MKAAVAFALAIPPTSSALFCGTPNESVLFQLLDDASSAKTTVSYASKVGTFTNHVSGTLEIEVSGASGACRLSGTLPGCTRDVLSNGYCYEFLPDVGRSLFLINSQRMSGNLPGSLTGRLPGKAEPQGAAISFALSPVIAPPQGEVPAFAQGLATDSWHTGSFLARTLEGLPGSVEGFIGRCDSIDAVYHSADSSLSVAVSGTSTFYKAGPHVPSDTQWVATNNGINSVTIANVSLEHLVSLSDPLLHDDSIHSPISGTASVGVLRDMLVTSNSEVVSFRHLHSGGKVAVGPSTTPGSCVVYSRGLSDSPGVGARNRVIELSWSASAPPQVTDVLKFYSDTPIFGASVTALSETVEIVFQVPSELGTSPASAFEHRSGSRGDLEGQSISVSSDPFGPVILDAKFTEVGTYLAASGSPKYCVPSSNDPDLASPLIWP